PTAQRLDLSSKFLPKFALVNNSSKGFGFGYDFGDDANYHIGDFQSIGGVSLVGRRLTSRSDRSWGFRRVVAPHAPVGRPRRRSGIPRPPRRTVRTPARARLVRPARRPRRGRRSRS